MKNLNFLSRSEMKKVLGGTEPVGGHDCEKTCTCDLEGTTAIARIIGCDSDTCIASQTSAECRVKGEPFFATCASACGAI